MKNHSRRLNAAKQTAGFLFLAVATVAMGQDAWRESAAARRATLVQKDSLQNNDYNIKAGPVLVKLNAAFGTEWNDNVTLSDKNPSSDFALMPSFNIGAYWPISVNNTLAFNFGIGYIKYVDHPQLDQLIIAPSSALSFDFHVADLAINLHERISQSQNSTTDPTVSGSGDFSAIENAVGLGLNWDLNRVVLSFGYDHYNFIATSSTFSNTLDRSSELLYLRGAVVVNEGLSTGVELGGGSTSYDVKTHNDSTYYSAGLFVAAQVTSVISLHASGGYVHYDFDQTGTLINSGAANGYYGDITVDHHLNQLMNHSLSFGRETRAGTSTDLFTQNYVRYRNNWNCIRDIILKSTFFYEWGSASGVGGESFSHYGGGLAASYLITKHLTGTLGYQIVVKDSNLPLRDYLQNRVNLDLNYSF